MLTVKINGKGYNSMINNVSWRTSDDTLGMQVDFEIPYRTKEIIKVGDTVTLFANGKLFSTQKVIDLERAGKTSRKVSCFDYAFYLNESELIIQFKNIAASDAIKQLCKKAGISVVINVKLPYKIKKIYKGETFSEILKDILEHCKKLTGTQYFFELQNKTLVIAKIGDYKVNVPFNLLIDPVAKESMAEMKNQVVVVSNDEKSMKTYTKLSNSANIKRFGLLQKVETIDTKERSKAKKIAQEQLKALNKITRTGNFKVLGNFNLALKANRVIELSDEVTGLKGQYVIVSANHNPTSANNNRYIAELEVRKI